MEPAWGHLEPVPGDDAQGYHPALPVLRKSRCLRRLFFVARSLREQCPRCGVRFEREEGYFLGAYALNLIVAEFVGLGLAIVLIFKTDLRHLPLIWQEVIAVALAIAFPVILFPFSRTVWIAMDLMFHPPKHGSERQLRGTLSQLDDD